MCLAVIALLFITQRKALRDNTLTAKKGITPGWIIFFSVLLLELGAGYYFHINGFFMGNAVSRVANAFYVLYIQPPHLASIGFVWNPLPSLLELPLMTLVQVYKPLATAALAGVIVTSFAAAGAALLIYKNCVHFKIPNWATYLMVALYAFNPFIFLYGFNGMSEGIFIFTIVLVVTELVRWIDDEKWTHLVWIGIALVLAFLTRYEAIPFAAAVFVTLAFFMFKKQRLQHENDIENHFAADEYSNCDDNRNRKSLWDYFEGTSVVVFMPLVTGVIVWILLNWIIMGDPLYFLTSQYSNIVQSSENLGEDMLSLVGNVGGVFIFVIKKVFIFIPVLIAILVLRYIDKRLFKWETLMLIALVASIPAFQYIMIIMGNSFGWLRFFVYPLPIVMAWLPYEFVHGKARRPAFNRMGVILCCVALVISSVLTGFVFNSSSLASEEYSTYTRGDSSVVLQKEVADYINQNCSDSVILMDSFETWYVILSMDATDNIITTCSYTFEAALENPREYSVGYILTVNPEGLGVSDAVNMYYSDLYENGADWCTLVKDFGDYRLYELIY
jgi:hypothetical protein